MSPSTGEQATRELALLALDAGVRETGWALFQGMSLTATGVISDTSRKPKEAALRFSHLVEGLDGLVEEWRPASAVLSQPSGIHWPVPALELLEASLTQWSIRNGFSLVAYSAQEIRTAVVGHPNASLDQLAYSIMLRLGLIGVGKTTHEWEAVAVGHHHLSGRKSSSPN